MSETGHSKHVVSGVPIAVRNDILEVTFVLSGLDGSLQSGIPDEGKPSLGTTHQVLAIGRDGTLDHLLAALGTEESLLDSRSFICFVFNQPNAVVSRLNIDLILLLSVDYDLVDLIAFYLFMLDQEVLDCLDLLVLDVDTPGVNLTEAITNE